MTAGVQGVGAITKKSRCRQLLLPVEIPATRFSCLTSGSFRPKLGLCILLVVLIACLFLVILPLLSETSYGSFSIFSSSSTSSTPSPTFRSSISCCSRHMSATTSCGCVTSRSSVRGSETGIAPRAPPSPRRTKVSG